MLDHIFDLLKHIIAHDAVSLVLLNKRGELEQVAERGHPDSTMTREFIRNMPLEELSARWGDNSVAVIPDTVNDPRWHRGADGIVQARSWIGAALRVKGELHRCAEHRQLHTQSLQ